MNWLKVSDYRELSETAASILMDAIEAKPNIVLGLPTGSTPTGLYAHVVEQCRDRRWCFKDVVTFNLDEYLGISPAHPGSYAAYMKSRLFDHVDINPGNVHIPRGDIVDESLLDTECKRYEAAIADAGGIDLMFLGMGRNGHIAFNEPGTPFDIRTHVTKLNEGTRDANRPYFPDGDVPTHAITMGIATILEAKKIVLLASGSPKRKALSRLSSGERSTDFPASALHGHDCLVLADVEAGP